MARYIVYKLPSGYNSYYIDSNNKQSWKKMAKPINDVGHPVGKTLGYIYGGRQTQKHFVYSLYNDASHSPPNKNLAHAKAKQLSYNCPHVYDHSKNIAGSSIKDVGKTKSCLQKSMNIVELKSKDQQAFQSFAKPRDCKIDIYLGMADEFKSKKVLCHTWRKTGITTDPKVTDIKKIKMKGENKEFKSGSDHSKWAITTDSKKPWTCIGDLNRATTQQKRGGGLLCINNADVWKRFREINYSPTAQTTRSPKRRKIEKGC
ncbi:plancitoxin-1-like [Glandiceps talaboti]